MTDPCPQLAAHGAADGEARPLQSGCAAYLCVSGPELALPAAGAPNSVSPAGLRER